MRASERQVLWFTEVGKQDIPLVGGKGANLGEITQAQIPVPPGFIVTAHTYSRFLEQSGLRPTIEKLLSPLDYNDSARLQEVSEEIKSLICSAPVPQQIAAEIKKAYRQLGGGPVAVRSSATAEDLPDASFAGQQSTFLNVVGEDEVVDAVRACWASLFEARAIFYRVDKGFEHMKVAIAVPVQRMVQSSRSGVMFTLEPVSGDRSKIAIEAVFGLGEAIVSGELTPDLYVLDKASLRILEKRVVDQERQFVRNPEAGAEDGANIWLAVPGELREQQKLTDEQIVALAAIGKQVEEHYDFPQDIEWAEDEGEGEGELYILQTRPVTALAVAEVEGEEAEETAPVLVSGSPASPGAAVGPVKIVLSSSEINRVEQGDVLVAEMTTRQFGVFLCHNSEDKLAVKEIGERLKQLGILPWLDEWEIPPFKRWQDELQEIISQIKAAAVFIGPSGVGPWQDIEINALLEQFARRKIPMGAVLLPDCPEEPELPLFLSGFRWVDFRKQDPDPMEQLVWGITGKRSPAGRIT